MKKLLYALTGLCLLAGLFAGCEKPNATSDGTPKENYTETAFGMNLEMVYVEGGTFEMGATAEQGSDAENMDVPEKPVRTIKLNSYYIGKYEVTQAQWNAVMGTTFKEQRDKVNEDWWWGRGEGDDYPMYCIKWTEIQEFCQRLSEATGKKYVLPTEAMWEYAARGGKKSRHYKYAGSNDIDEVAWHGGSDGNDANSGSTTHPVGTKKANEIGIYDMSGNLWELCSDWFANMYDVNDTDNPQGPVIGEFHVVRGGSWYYDAVTCRVSCRNITGDGYCLDEGFRVACIAE